MQKLLTIAEAALALNVSEATVRGLCTARKVRHERHGRGRGTIRISLDALGEYRAAVTVLPGTEAKSTPHQRAELKHLSLD